MSGTLCAHKDTTAATEAMVRSEPRPEFTSTWRPYSHADVLDAVGKACATLDWTVARKTYSMKPDAKMFGVWDLEKKGGELVKGKETTLSVGIRNSIDKTMSVGLCAGVRVFVCDNLVFRGDFVLFRKHTGRLEVEELLITAEEALKALSSRFDRVVEWHDGLKKIELTDQQASTLAVAAMVRKYPVIPPSKFDSFHDLYFDPKTKYTPTLHGFHGAITEMYQSTSMLDYMTRTNWLVDFLDFEAPMILGREKSATVWAPKRVPFAALQEEAKSRKEASREAAQDGVQAEVHGVREKVLDRMKAAKDAAKPKVERIVKSDPKGLKAKVEIKAGKAKIAEVSARTEKQKAVDEKMKTPRRTARVKIREKIAAEADPVKTKVGKAPKGEVVKKAKAKAKDVEGDVYFCTDCQGEFMKRQLVTVDGDLVCDRCLEGRNEAKAIAKKKGK